MVFQEKKLQIILCKVVLFFISLKNIDTQLHFAVILMGNIIYLMILLLWKQTLKRLKKSKYIYLFIKKW